MNQISNVLAIWIIASAFVAIGGVFYLMVKNATEYPSDYDEDLKEYQDINNQLMEGKRDGQL